MVKWSGGQMVDWWSNVADRRGHARAGCRRRGAWGGDRHARVVGEGGCTFFARLGSALVSSSSRATSRWPNREARWSPVLPSCGARWFGEVRGAQVTWRLVGMGVWGQRRAMLPWNAGGEDAGT